jgi:hypothetical protein
MRCHELAELLIAYQDGEAAPAQRELIDLHLQTCAACRDRLARDRLVAQRIRTLADRPCPVPPARQQALLRRTAAPARPWYSWPAARWSARYLHAPRFDNGTRAPGGLLAGLMGAIPALLVAILLAGAIALFTGRSLPGQMSRPAAPSRSTARNAAQPTTEMPVASYTAFSSIACQFANLSSAGPTQFFVGQSPALVAVAGQVTMLRVVPGNTFGATQMTLIAFPVSGPACAQLRFPAVASKEGQFTGSINFPYPGAWYVTAQFGGHECTHKVQVTSPPGASGARSVATGTQGGSPIFGTGPVLWLMPGSAWRQDPVTVTLHVFDRSQGGPLPIIAVPLDSGHGTALRYAATLTAWDRASRESTYALRMRLPAPGSWLLIAHMGASDSGVVVQVA